MEKENLLSELKRLNSLIGTDNWDIVRNSNNYILKKRKYSWAVRNYYEIPKENYHKYLDMQASRGITTHDITNKGIDEWINKRKKEIDDKNGESNPENNIEKYMITHIQKRYLEIKNFLLDTKKIKNIYEIGFRLPILLEFYKRMNLNAAGCDTVKSNVMLGKLLKYNVEVLDFNNIKQIQNLKINENTCIISYHCFEHLEDPLESLKNLYSIMPINSYLHIEIPVEPNRLPNTKVGHLQAFYRNDLKNMLKECGFSFLNSYNDDGNERHLVFK